LESAFDTSIFTEPTLKGKLGVSAVEAQKSLYDYLLYDSSNERNFAKELDASTDVVVYVKLPSGFYISTPVGKYNPDWAISFHEGAIKHIYFVAETKGSMNSLQLREIESAKIHCAREHFKAISSDSVVYGVVDSFSALMSKVMQ
jgi:type III restriction enzyme